jgi:hypothetical protein
MRYLKSLVFAVIVAAGLYFAVTEGLGWSRNAGMAAAALVIVPLLIWWRRPWRKRRRRSGPPRIPIPSEVRRYVYARDRYTCAYCGRSGRNLRLTIDHIMPVSRGGSNEIGNLVTACRACNLSKGAKIMDAVDLHNYAIERRAMAGRERRAGCLRRIVAVLMLAAVAAGVVFYLVNIR